MRVEVQVKRLQGFGDDISLPTYATEGAAAFDLRAAIPHNSVHIVEPGARDVIDTGLAVAIPPGFEMQIRPRSGLALKYGVSIANTPATIDSDFRGHVQILIINLGQAPFEIKRGDRIAQAVVAPVFHAELREVDELQETVRGSNGFGSTGTA